MNKFITFFLGLVLLGTACEDRFEQVVKVDIPEHEPRLALNAIFFSDDEALSVLVSNSVGILDTNSFQDFKTADVRLLKDGQLLGDFFYEQGNGYYINTLDVPIGNEEAVYQLEAAVESDGFPTASAVQTMPRLPELGAVTVEKEGTIDDSGERVDEVVIEIVDAPGEEAYYAIQAYVAVDNSEPFQVSLYSNNPISLQANRSNLGLILSDASFDGSTYTLNAYSYGIYPYEIGEGLDVSLTIVLANLTRDTYLYVRSLSQYYDAQGNPFAEPVTVYSNIEDGYGIFGLGNTVSKTVELE
jgi:hypothetical protein